MNTLQKLSQDIKQQRDAQGLTYQTMAHLLKIRPSLIESFEQEINENMSVYHFNHLRRICDMLSISIEPYKDCFSQFQSQVYGHKQMPQISLDERRKKPVITYALIAVLLLAFALVIKNYFTSQSIATSQESPVQLTAQIIEPKPLHHHHTVLDS